MYFSEAVAVVGRRWYVVLVGLVLIFVAGVAAFTNVPTQYQATGEVLVLPPVAELGERERANPYLNLPNGLTFTATLVAGSLMTQDTIRDVAELGYESSYSVSVFPGGGPVIGVSVEGTDPDAILATRDHVVGRIESTLADIQAAEDVSESQLMQPRRYSVGGRAEVLAGSRIRALAGIAAVGAILTALAVFAIDRRASSRAARRSAARDEARRSRAARRSAASEPFGDVPDAESDRDLVGPPRPIDANAPAPDVKADSDLAKPARVRSTR